MRAFVEIRDPKGVTHELVHGDVIGRLHSAALSLDDGRVSEAHAMVSLREQELRLVSLRGGFALDGKPLRELALRPGQVIQLALGLQLEVVRVELPAAVLGVEGDSVPRQVVPPVASVIGGERPRLARGHHDGALAWVWDTGAGWRIQREADEPRALEVGESVDLAAGSLRFIEIPLAGAGLPATRRIGAVGASLWIVALFDTVHIHREGVRVLSLSGVLARIVSELAIMAGPVPWAVLAKELWPRVDDLQVVRSRLDVHLSRLRRKLREARVRSDLVRTDGAGHVELILYPGDQVEDRS